MNSYDSSFWSRLATLQRPGEAASAFARRLGVPATTLSSIKSGTLPRIDTAAAIAAAAGVTIDWLIGNDVSLAVAPDLEGQASTDTALASADMVMVPVIDAQPSAGSGSNVDAEPVAGVIALRRDLVRGLGVSSPGALRVLEARGNSMEPTIRAGDLILVDTAIDRVEDEGVYVFRFGGALVVKRIRFTMAAGIQLVSDNGGSAERIAEADLPDLHAAGRVVRVIRAL